MAMKCVFVYELSMGESSWGPGDHVASHHILTGESGEQAPTSDRGARRERPRVDLPGQDAGRHAGFWGRGSQG